MLKCAHQSLLPYELHANVEEKKLSVLKHDFSSRADSSILIPILP